MYRELKENKPHGTKDYPYTQYRLYNIDHAFQIPVHWHEELEIIYVRKGTLNVTIDGESYVGRAGSIFIVNPGQLHLMGSSDSSIDYYTLLFPLEFISFQSKDALERELLFPLRNHNIAFIPEFPQGEMGQKCCLLLDQLIFLNKRINAKKFSDTEKQFSTRILLLQWLQLVVEYQLIIHTKTRSPMGIQKELLTFIQQNYTGHITLQILSEHFHLSEKYISRYFKEHFHLTLSQYINYLRLSHAKTLLENTNLAVTEVAMHCGFSNVSYFIRTFKASFNVSPLQYRTQNQNANHFCASVASRK